jgi:hypothetical protein
MPVRGEDFIILAEIFVDRLGFGRGLDNNDFHEGWLRKRALRRRKVVGLPAAVNR